MKWSILFFTMCIKVFNVEGGIYNHYINYNYAELVTPWTGIVKPYTNGIHTLETKFLHRRRGWPLDSNMKMEHTEKGAK